MASVIIVFFLAFLLILKGGDLLVESSIWFAKKTKIPSIVVGATVVAIATTFPEMSVSLMSGLAGAESLAINTAIGSMVCNFALVLGLAFLIKPAEVQRVGLARKVVYFLVSIFILLIVAVDQELTRVDMVILFVVFGVFITLNIIEARNTKEPAITMQTELPGWGKTILQFVLSAFAIGFGANILVNNVESLSNILGISEGLVGTFIIAVGTNIPEFVTTLTSIRLNDSEIGVGNIFGASVIDASLLIAVTIASSKNDIIMVPKNLILLTIPALILITAIIVLPILKKNKSNRIQGVLLVIIFVLYSLILAKIS